MSAPQILAAARELMLLGHGPGCSDRAFWVELAGLLQEAETTFNRESALNGAGVVTGMVRRALNVANAYLDLPVPDHTKEHSHG